MSKLISRLLSVATFLGCFLGILLGCSTTSLKDLRVSPASQSPGYDFVVQNRDASASELSALATKADNQTWWKKYRLGLLNLDKAPKLACGFFSELSGESFFPLKDLALLRAHQSCEKTDSLVKFDPEFYRTNYKFAQNLVADVVLKEARKTADKTDDIAALREAAKFETVPRKKEKLLLEAIEDATELKNTAEVEALRTQLYRSSPRLNPELPAKELPAAAMDFRQRREFDKALAIYESILKDPKTSEDEKFQALKNIRMTYKIAQNKNAYIEATTQMVNHTKSEFKKTKRKNSQVVRHLHESYVLLARTLWTEDQMSLALQTLSEAQRQLKGLHSMDEVYFILARISEEKGDLPKASEYYEASLKEDSSSASIRDKVAWSYPWLLYKMKNYERAAQIFHDYAEKTKDASDRTRAQFWQARALKNLQRTEEATTVLKKLIQDDPIGYYGVLAVRELGQSYPTLKSNEKDFSYSLSNLNELTPLAALQAEWLMAVGENSFAEKVIDQVAESLRKKGRGDEQSWLVIFSSYARANLYLPLFAAFSTLPQEMKETMVLKHPELLFPRNYKEVITKSAETEQIPPEFAFSIIRQESAFNPRARSPVDAFGLMQLLPSLGKSLAKGTKIPYDEAEDLFDPEINVPLGTKELSHLLARYDKQYILAVSAYNASDSAIRGWLKTRYREDALEFIEDVPYDETRTYIKLVLRNFVFYKRLNQTEAQVGFPEEWLRLVSK
jgi:soluble lytic murein transglycosylase